MPSGSRLFVKQRKVKNVEDGLIKKLSEEIDKEKVKIPLSYKKKSPPVANNERAYGI